MKTDAFAETYAPQAEEPTWAPEPGEELAMLVGAPGAGKTTLLRALHAAPCSEQEAGYPRIRLHSVSGDGDGVVRGEADRLIDGVLPVPTQVPGQHAVRVTVTRRSLLWLPRARTMVLALGDQPGERLTDVAEGRDVQRSLANAAAAAHTLVICVDPVRPVLEVLGPGLWNLVENAIDPPAAAPSGFLRATLGLLGPAQAPAHMPTRRVLVLLTKIDQWARDNLGRARNIRTERDLAERVDAVALAKQVLGARLLRHVHRSLAPSARLAVGVCSANGFDAQGRPIEIGDGPLDIARWRDWRPYGLRDVLDFICTGTCSGVVTPCGHEELD